MVINISKQNSTFVERTQTVTQYHMDVRRFKQLSPEDERKLFEIYFSKDSTEQEKEKARETIINANLRFVLSAAKQYGNSDNYLDIVSEGNIALMQAFEKYSLDKESRFLTYASEYIRRNITQYLRDVEPSIRRKNISQTFHVISKAHDLCVQELQREPTEEELMEVLNEKFGTNIKDIGDVMQVNLTSIDSYVGDEEDGATVGDLTLFNNHSASSNDYENDVDRDDDMNKINIVTKCLSPREKEIIFMSYGINQPDGQLEPKDIAEKMGLTPERVRQIIHSAMDRLQAESTKMLSSL